MKNIPEKIVLLLSAAALCCLRFSPQLAVLPTLVAVSAVCLLEIKNNVPLLLCIFVGFLVYAAFLPEACIFAAVLVCQFRRKYDYLLLPLLFVPPILNADIASAIYVALVSAVATLWNFRSVRENDLHDKFYSLLDSASLGRQQAEQEERRRREQQYLQIEIAKAEERNRIAREIHDNVGHILSGCILQAGALLATVKDTGEKAALLALKDNLTSGMNSIRESVHDLHEEIVILEDELARLCENFTFCEISLSFKSSNPKKQYALPALAIVKECLSNVIKHSDATQVSVSFLEHTAFYRLKVSDNGSRPVKISVGGLGLKSIEERAKALGGNLSTSADKGFTVLVTLPKQ